MWQVRKILLSFQTGFNLVNAAVVRAILESISGLENSEPVHSLMLSSHLFLCLPCLLPPLTVPCKMDLAKPDKRET